MRNIGKLAMRIATPVVLLVVLHAQSAHGAIYRCETEGKLTYGDTPCAAGKESTVTTPRPPTPEERAAAERAAQAERHALNAIENRRRREQEALFARQREADRRALEQERLALLRQQRDCQRRPVAVPTRQAAHKSTAHQGDSNKKVTMHSVPANKPGCAS